MEFKYKESDNDGIDFVHSYACEVMNLGLLYMEYCDAIKRDGDRVICV